MFERFTELARRAVFWALHEAHELRSGYIEPEHLTLGILADNGLIRRYLPNDIAVDEVRRALRALTPPCEGGREGDLPLSAETKQVLRYAAEVAEQVKHRHIGREHLLFGLLHDETRASKVLMGFGINREDVWRELSSGHPR